MYECIKTINGIEYRYQQETYRENGKVKTRSVYIGPVDGGRRKKGLTGFVQNLVKKKDRREDIGESDAEASARVAREDTQRAKNERVNGLLTAPSISLGAIGEISASQQDSKEGVTNVAADSGHETGSAAEAGSDTGESGTAPGE